MKKSENKMYLKDKIYQQIVHDLTSGKIKPGDYLTELSICDQYKVSRTPVREALIKLSYENFLTQFKKGGYLVKDISYRELFELLDLRELLEVYAAGLAAERISEDHLAIMKDTSIYHELDEWFAKNRTFHMTIARASGNGKLAEMLEQVLDQTKRIYLIDATNLYPLPDENEHTHIYRAFADHDKKKAVELVRRHLVDSRIRLKQQLLS